MSLLMTPADHYPPSHENSPSQSAMGFAGPYASMYVHNNQWQTFGSSPTSGTPSPMNPMGPSSSLNGPAVPSPLLHSVSGPTPQSTTSHHVGGLNATPQPPPVHTPASAHPQCPIGVVPMLKNPFEEDIYSRPSSQHQPPHLHYDLLKGSRLPYYHNMEGNIRLRCPYAFNTTAGERHNFNYPPQLGSYHLLRTPYSKFASLMAHPLLDQKPSTTTAAPATTTKRSKRKKSEPQASATPQLPPPSPANQESGKQTMTSHMNGIMHNPNGPFNCSPIYMGHNTPEMSNDSSHQCNSPSLLPHQMKGRPTSTESFSPFPPNFMSRPSKPMPVPKYVVNSVCFSCKMLIRDKPGIRCTALGQGCGSSYHMECAGLASEAYHMLVADIRCEWVCQMCSKQKSLYFCM